MEALVDRFVEKHRLIPKGATIVVGVSGGPDSMALLNYLLNRADQWDLSIIAASVDHQLRGEASRADWEYVAGYCKSRGIPFEGKRVDVRAYQKAHRVSEEVAARHLRYDFFQAVMEKHGAHLLALGHHGDDQIETMLMRQVRGSFGIAKAGILVKRRFGPGHIIRPLLSVSKADIESYCRKCGIEPRRDETNDSGTYTRNRFRKVVLPFLKQENPLVHMHFQQDSERMADDFRFLDALAEKELSEILKEKTDNSVTVFIDRLLRTAVPLQRRVIHLILNYLYSTKRMVPAHQMIHIESLLEWLAREKASGEWHFPAGLRAERSYNYCTFYFWSGEAVEPYDVPLTVPGPTELPTGTIWAEWSHTYDKEAVGKEFFVCDMDKVRFPIRARTRRPGDRMRPAGVSGTKKLKSLFIDHKIPQKVRDVWPVIVDAEGDIMWVPLVRHGDYARYGNETSVYLILKFEPTADFRRICNEGRSAGNTLYGGNDSREG